MGTHVRFLLRVSVAIATGLNEVRVKNEAFANILSIRWVFHVVGHAFFSGPSRLNRQNRCIFGDFTACWVISRPSFTRDVLGDVIRDVMRRHVFRVVYRKDQPRFIGDYSHFTLHTPAIFYMFVPLKFNHISARSVRTECHVPAELWSVWSIIYCCLLEARGLHQTTRPPSRGPLTL